MSNKTQLQTNNIELQSILNEIQGLPGGVTINLGTQEGELIGELSKDTTSGYYQMEETEDPFEEIEDQSPLLEQLAALVTKKYMIEGLYVWSKTSSYSVENPVIQIHTVGNTTMVTSEVVDLQKVDEEFFDGFTFITQPQNYYFQYIDGVLYYVNPNASAALNYDPITATFNHATGDGQFSYTGEKTVFLGEPTYVISDNQEAYPENGVREDYWYKKLDNTDITAALGASEVQTGSITFSANTDLQNANINIIHNLNMAPVFFAIYSLNTIGNIVACIMVKNTQTGEGITYDCDIAIYSQLGTSRPHLAVAKNIGEMTETNILLPKSSSFTENYIFQSGVNYHWFAMA